MKITRVPGMQSLNTQDKKHHRRTNTRWECGVGWGGVGWGGKRTEKEGSTSRASPIIGAIEIPCTKPNRETIPRRFNWFSLSGSNAIQKIVEMPRTKDKRTKDITAYIQQTKARAKMRTPKEEQRIKSWTQPAIVLRMPPRLYNESA